VRRLIHYERALRMPGLNEALVRQLVHGALDGQHAHLKRRDSSTCFGQQLPRLEICREQSRAHVAMISFSFDGAPGAEMVFCFISLNILELL